MCGRQKDGFFFMRQSGQSRIKKKKRYKTVDKKVNTNNKWYRFGTSCARSKQNSNFKGKIVTLPTLYYNKFLGEIEINNVNLVFILKSVCFFVSLKLS